MNLSKWSARFALGLMTVSMLIASATAVLRWSVFAQAAVFGAGLILAAIVHRPTRSAIRLAVFYVACVFLLALIESWSGSKVLPVWLYGGLSFAYWLQIQSERRLTCWCWFRQLPAANSIKEVRR